MRFIAGLAHRRVLRLLRNVQPIRHRKEVTVPRTWHLRRFSGRAAPVEHREVAADVQEVEAEFQPEVEAALVVKAAPAAGPVEEPAVQEAEAKAVQVAEREAAEVEERAEAGQHRRAELQRIHTAIQFTRNRARSFLQFRHRRRRTSR